MARQSFDAAIGSVENTAWVLQGTLAILVIAAAVFAIKPDMLTYVRSFEYGGFKATFADHSTATSIADLKYKDLLWGLRARTIAVAPTSTSSTWTRTRIAPI